MATLFDSKKSIPQKDKNDTTLLNYIYDKNTNLIGGKFNNFSANIEIETDLNKNMNPPARRKPVALHTGRQPVAVYKIKILIHLIGVSQ